MKKGEKSKKRIILKKIKFYETSSEKRDKKVKSKNEKEKNFFFEKKR